MLNPLNFISKLIKSSNQKELDRIAKIVTKVNSFEDKTQKVHDENFPKKTQELKDKLKDGSDINELLPEAFALVREASKRTRGERHYDAQIMGGIVLHEGKIAVVVYHDEDNDGKLKTGLFWRPKEGYAFSNSYKPKTPPKFSKALIELIHGKPIEIELNY